MFEGQTGRRIGQVLCRTVEGSAMQSSGLSGNAVPCSPLRLFGKAHIRGTLQYLICVVHGKAVPCGACQTARAPRSACGFAG